METLVTKRNTFRLRYVGKRFDNARLPLDVISDLPAFRDLLVSYAKEGWRESNAERQRLPRGFDASISFDLVSIDRGSTVPRLDWDRSAAQATLPGFADELEMLVDRSYGELTSLIDGAGNDQLPRTLSSEHIRALNRLGSGLREDERIEFLGSRGADGNVVFLDTYRRKKLITHVRETYQARFEGIGRLLGTHVDGSIDVETKEHGNIEIKIDPDRIVAEFDGNLNSDVQFSLQIELDHRDNLRNIVDVFEVELTDAADLVRCRRRLIELRGLKAGWYDGSGAEISSAAFQEAEKFLEKRPVLAGAYRIYPTEAGGVLFEFEHDGWDFTIEFSPSGMVEMYGVEIQGLDEMEPELFEAVTPEFIARFDRRLGR